MRKLYAGLLLSASMVLLYGCGPALKTQRDKLSYSVGYNYGKSFKQQSMEFDEKMFARGMRDALDGKKSLLSEEEIDKVFEIGEKELMIRQEERAAKLKVSNKEEGEAFLAENEKKPGVITRPSGLQYEVITEGAGKKPTATDSVIVHYKGTLLDGTEFDNSYKRGEPATFQVTKVIPGWTEALQLMKTGSKWRVYIPPHLAYGEHGVGQIIGPNAVLIFDIELIGIK